MIDPSAPPDLAAFFRPTSVCLIGISERPGSAGRRLVENLLGGGYGGDVVGVHPREGAVLGIPCVPTIDDLTGVPDVAVLSLPAAACESTLDALGRQGVRRAVVFASGFGEVGGEGDGLDVALREVCQRHDLLVVGPNCMGTVDLTSGVALTFSSALAVEPGLPHEPIAVVAQSGAVGALLWQSLRQRGCPPARLVSSGNESVLSGAALAAWLLEQDTELVCWYAERWTVEEVEALGARALAAQKTVLLLPGGVSEAGRRATRAHTGSISHGDVDQLRKVSDATGSALQVVRTPTELLDAAVLSRRAPKGAGVVIASSGGMSVLAAEAAERHGLALADLSEETKAQVRELLPAFGAAGNPVDITAELFYQPERVQAIARVVATDPAVGWIVLVGALAFSSATALVSAVTQELSTAGRDLFVAWEGAEPAMAAEVTALGVPFFRDIDEAMSAIGARVPTA